MPDPVRSSPAWGLIAATTLGVVAAAVATFASGALGFFTAALLFVAAVALARLVARRRR